MWRTLTDSSMGSDVAALYVGAKTCVECHAAQGERWRQSMHARAMETPTPDSVKAPFAGERFSLHGVTSTFSRSGNRFIVHTDGPDGAPHDFDVAYTFGVEPLQQYLLALPGGRYQALSISWDTRPAAAGGRRWFHLLPHAPLPAGDVQHWTSPSQNWNARCAECHSTNLRKGYDAAHNSYKTTWSDISVACESCHGAGSRHVAWARGRRVRRAARGRRRRWAGAAGIEGRRHVAARCGDAASRIGIAPRTSRVEVEMCARCHARRAVLTDEYHVGLPLTETHRPVAAGRRVVLCGRTDSGRGLRVRIVPPEPDVRQRRHVQRLPRSAPAGDRVEPRRVCQRCHLPRSSRPRRTITMPPTHPARNAWRATCPRGHTWLSIRDATTASASRGRISR